MKTCKDCLHREACNGWEMSEVLRERLLAMNRCDCKCFTDRSEWVHLPCNVGDKLYKVVPDFEKPRGNMTIQEYTVSGIGIKVIVSNPYNVFGAYRIGADVFLTREEAENALERMK